MKFTTDHDPAAHRRRLRIAQSRPAWFGDRLTFDILALLLPLAAFGILLAAMGNLT